MFIKITQADGSGEKELLAAMSSRKKASADIVKTAVSEIFDNVKANGFAAVDEYSRRFDKAPVREIGKDELRAAYDSCPKALISALEKAASNIRSYHEKMLARSWETGPAGAVTGQVVRGMSRVGMYVPGGTAAYPSSVLMNAIPAKVAGVDELIMVTPPGKNMSTAVLAAALIAGVDRVIGVGGAQAIAALAYGAGFIPRVDKIVGPGNAYVAEAKRLAYGLVDIDMVAGPSEVLIIADASADPVFAAADMLSQAEHDALASAVILTDSKEFAERASEEIEKQLALLPRRETAEASVRDFGAVVVCSSLEACADLANEIAPEHLEILTDDPRALLPLIKNAGAVFLGKWSPEPLGDYMAGPCHVLPTSGTARFFSPLSTDSFLKKMSIIEYSEESLKAVAEEIELLADSEGLIAHKRSVERRFSL